MGMEHYLTDYGGMGAFLALIVLKIVEWAYTYFSTRDANIKTLQCAIKKNTDSMLSIQKDLRRFKIDLRRAFFALERVSGDDWPKISDEMNRRHKHEDDIGGS